mmetsp:Transcript_22101/g.52226  ORF Transcript_22101/g.52226 Transcript_22101/m.52226 type:complete len:98 (-) Transcript_22101:102-395(-)
MHTCSLRRSDVIGKRLQIPNGCPGLKCRHCRGTRVNIQGSFFTKQVKMFSGRTKSVNGIYRHIIVRCKARPREVTDRLSVLGDAHSRGIRELGAQYS